MSFLHFLFNFILFSFSFNLLSMKEEEVKPVDLSSILFTKKEIKSDENKIKTFKKNYTFQTLLSPICLVSLFSITAYTSYKKNEIPLIDIIGFGIHKASQYNKQIETLFKKISFNNTIYWQNPFKLFLTTPNILFLSTIGTTYALLPQLTKKKFPLCELNSTEANEIIKSTDHLLEYVEFFKHISVKTTDITEFCLSIKNTNQNIKLSEEQKKAFAKQINELYTFSEVQYNLDFFNNTEKLEALKNAIMTIKIENSDKFFDENTKQQEAITKTKETITKLKNQLTEDNIKKISFLEKLKIKQQTLRHMLMKEEEVVEIDINNQEQTKKFLEIDYKQLETDLKKTNFLVKKMTQELKDIYSSQKELYEEIKQLRNPHQELFEQSWNGIHDWQKKEILKEIILNKTSEKLSLYAVKKIDLNNTVQSIFLENQTEHFIKEHYKKSFKSKILYFVKSSLPGHKINKEINKKIQEKQITSGLTYDIEIISKLPTAELKDIYREEQFQHYTIEEYKTLFRTAESIEKIDMLTLINLIKNKNFQMLFIDYLDTLNSELIINLTMHSPFLLNLSDKYNKFHNEKNEKNKKPYTEEQYKKFESFLSNITTIAKTSNNVYDTLPVYLKLSLEKYLKKNPKINTEYWTKNFSAQNENSKNQNNYTKLLEYFNAQEELKKHFVVIPGNQKN